MMRRLIFSIMLTAFAFSSLCAQGPERLAPGAAVPEGYEAFDSVVVRIPAAVDSSLVGKDIAGALEGLDNGSVTLTQSSSLDSALVKRIEANSARVIQGYRVRIFFDNKKSAKDDSRKIFERFTSKYPLIKAYRTYANPYFKVTVGDFRSRGEAMRLLRDISRYFPRAFVVKENINYPLVGEAVERDTLRFIRPVSGASEASLSEENDFFQF